jgi:hypothetical protein
MDCKWVTISPAMVSRPSHRTETQVREQLELLRDQNHAFPCNEGPNWQVDINFVSGENKRFMLEEIGGRKS